MTTHPSPAGLPSLTTTLSPSRQRLRSNRLVACRREFVTALERLESALALNRHKNCPSGVLALLTFSLRQATSVRVADFSSKWKVSEHWRAFFNG